MNHPPDSERAVSELFGAMVLIGVIVTGLAIAGVILLSQPQPQKIPDLNALFSSNAQIVQIQHNGGDSFLKSELQIRLDGVDKTSSFAEDGNSGWTTWSIGQSLTYNIPTGSSVPSLIQIVYTSGGISQLIASSGEGSTTGLSVQAPVVDSITPNSGNVGDTVHITNLVGSSFFSGATVKLSRAGSLDIPATNVIVVSSTQITCDISLPGATATKGAWDVVVTNLGGPSGTLSNGFTVLVPPPTITGISPSFGIRASGAKVNITGTNLTGATSVTFGTGNFATIDTNTATAINMTAPAGTGTVTVTVNTPGGSATTSYNYFIIQIFTASNPAWPVPTGVVGIDYLVVGGGGGGGGFSGGGGGAGGVYTSTLTTGLTGSKTVTIGTGGTAGTNGNGGNGGSSVFATITAAGGGAGAGGNKNANGGNAPGGGGSGGGAAGTGTGGTGVSGHGNNGGKGATWKPIFTNYFLGGGGGGMGAVGGTATGSAVPYTAGVGGAGTDYSGSFGAGFGESGFVAGGGGGGGSNNGGSTFGAGGIGGGGDGSVTGAGQAGTANTGGGGGGGSPTSGGGAGGSGLVVIKYY